MYYMSMRYILEHSSNARVFCTYQILPYTANTNIFIDTPVYNSYMEASIFALWKLF